MKKDARLILVFLVIMAAFVLIMAGIHVSEMRICRAAVILLIGALLYTPLRNRVFVKRKGGNTE